MTGLFYDLRFSVRGLLRDPGFTLTAITIVGNPLMRSLRVSATPDLRRFRRVWCRFGRRFRFSRQRGQENVCPLPWLFAALSLQSFSQRVPAIAAEVVQTALYFPLRALFIHAAQVAQGHKFPPAGIILFPAGQIGCRRRPPKAKSPSFSDGLFGFNRATSWSPTHLRVQYNRG